jgi:hypothetical protein
VSADVPVACSWRVLPLGRLEVGRYDDRNRDYTFADVFLRRRLDAGLSDMQGEGFLLAIAQAPSYIPGGGKSFWKLIGLLLLVIGFLIALWLIWVGLRWIIEKIAAAFRRK